MLIQMDRRIQEVLDYTLGALREDASPLEEIFSQESDRDRAVIRQYFQQTKISVRLGFPQAPTELPGLFLSIGGLQEQFTIGDNARDEVSTLRIAERARRPFEILVRISCWSINADVAVWLSNVALWALLAGRSTLNQYGIQKQAVTLQDFDYDPRFLPTFTYRRDLRVSATCEMSVTTEFFRLREVTVAPTTQETFEPVTLTMR